ncbi:MAG: hypothetical protein ACYCV7_14560 [Acidimicrobiales bacterium]
MEQTHTPGCRSVSAALVDPVVERRLLELVTPDQVELAKAAAAANLPLSTFIRQAALGAAGSLDVRAVTARVEAIQNEARKLAALLHGDAA